MRVAERPRQHRLPQRLRAFEVGAHLGLDLADDGQTAVDFGDDAVLFREGWEGDANMANAFLADISH